MGHLTKKIRDNRKCGVMGKTINKMLPIISVKADTGVGLERIHDQDNRTIEKTTSLMTSSGQRVWSPG